MNITTKASISAIFSTLVCVFGSIKAGIVFNSKFDVDEPMKFLAPCVFAIIACIFIVARTMKGYYKEDAEKGRIAIALAENSKKELASMRERLEVSNSLLTEKGRQLECLESVQRDLHKANARIADLSKANEHYAKADIDLSKALSELAEAKAELAKANEQKAKAISELAEANKGLASADELLSKANAEAKALKSKALVATPLIDFYKAFDAYKTAESNYRSIISERGEGDAYELRKQKAGDAQREAKALLDSNYESVKDLSVNFK